MMSRMPSQDRSSRSPRRRTLTVGAAALLLLAPLVASCGAFKRLAYEDFGSRDEWQQAERVTETLGILPGQLVADLGAGGGYFSFRLAEAVGPGGRVFAVDVDAGMTQFLADKARAEGADNLVAVLAAADHASLPEPVDLVFTCNTYHHLADRQAYFERLKASLRPGGRVAIIDYREGKHGTPPETIASEMAAAGYVLLTSHDWLDRQSFMVFGL